MKKSKLLALLSLLIQFTAFGGTDLAPAKDADWKLEKNRNGIKVYSRQESGSKFKEIRVLCEIEGTLSQFYSFFVDVDSYGEVIEGTKEAKMINQSNPYEFLYYTIIDLPWPASNRDLTIQVNIDVNEARNNLVVQAENKEGVKPENSSLVRVPYWRSEWRVRQKGNNLLDIEYFFKVDPGGSLPAWIVNETAPKSTYQTFVNLEENLKLPRYQNKSYPFLDS